jgi:hypothetical protein
MARQQCTVRTHCGFAWTVYRPKASPGYPIRVQAQGYLTVKTARQYATAILEMCQQEDERRGA